jgi:outer membrane protein OmpA-like peptidoglycan-associated protein
MRNEVLALLVAALVVPAAGCATKEYVREVVGESQTKLDTQLREQAQLVSGQGKRLDAETARIDAQGKQLEDMGGRFTKLETSVDEFGNIVRTASTKADEAVARADEVGKRVSRLLANASKRRVVETIQVHFVFNRADLTDATQTSLAALIKELAENPALTVDLEGYTDSLGPADYNVGLSERRVEAVRRFLVAHGVELSRVNWIGMGKLQGGSPAERAKNRRVTLRLMLPEDQPTAQQSSSKPVEEPVGPRAAGGGKAAAPMPGSAETSPPPPSPTAEDLKATEPQTAAPASSVESGSKPTERKDSSQ